MFFRGVAQPPTRLESEEGKETWRKMPGLADDFSDFPQRIHQKKGTLLEGRTWSFFFMATKNKDNRPRIKPDAPKIVSRKKGGLPRIFTKEGQQGSNQPEEG